jgi:hypothetical protein
MGPTALAYISVGSAIWCAVLAVPAPNRNAGAAILVAVDRHEFGSVMLVTTVAGPPDLVALLRS